MSLTQIRKRIAIAKFVKRVNLDKNVSLNDAVKHIYPYGDCISKTLGMYRKIRSIIKKERESSISVKRVEVLSIDDLKLPFILKYKDNSTLKFRQIVYVRQGEFEIPLLDRNKKGEITIHVAFGSAKIIMQLGEQKKEFVVNVFRSVKIREEDRKNAAVKLQISGSHACLLLEQNVNFNVRRLINRKFQNVVSKYKINYLRNEVAYVKETEYLNEVSEYMMSSPYSKIPISYIRNELSLEDIRRRILFLDCEFVGGYKEPNKLGKWKGTSLLASICIMKYDGEIILNTHVTPSKKIKSYVKWITGFTPQDLRNKRKDFEIISEVQKLVIGKVLIGHDLTADLEVLKISKETLMGIRDLSTSSILMEMTECKNSRLKLGNLATEFLGRSIYNNLGQHSGLRDVQAIRDLYIKFEKQWEDDLGIDDYKNYCDSDSDF